jgi:hypothetical protein
MRRPDGGVFNLLRRPSSELLAGAHPLLTAKWFIPDKVKEADVESVQTMSWTNDQITFF